MASITAGTGGTIKSTTLEAQLQEICMLLQISEATPVNNPDQLDRISVSHDSDTSNFTATFNFPVEQTINPEGQINYSALDYLVDLDFSPGTGGTFKSNSLTGYLMEALIYAQNVERQAIRNPANRNGATGSFNSDSTIFTGSLSLPVLISVEPDGSIKYVADEYLLD